MRVVIEKKLEDSCNWVADYIAKRINTFKPDSEIYFNLGLSPGFFKN